MLLVAPFVASAFLLIAATIIGNVRLEMIGSNGLVQIEYPYAGYGLYMYFLGWIFLLFGFLSFPSVTRSEANSTPSGIESLGPRAFVRPAGLRGQVLYD